MLSTSILKKGKQKIVRTIATDRPDSVLQSWPYLEATSQADYYALYPRSGISLERMKDWPVKLAVVQFSPVIPHNYKESSYPGGHLQMAGQEYFL